MITEQAIVTQCFENRVEVELQRSSACGHCELAKGCGTGALGRLLGRRNKPLSLYTEKKLQPGDHVVLGLSESALVSSSLITYGAPLLLMLFFSLLASLAGLPEIPVVLLAGAGFFAGMKLSGWLLSLLGVEFLTPEIIYIQVNPQAGSRS